MILNRKNRLKPTTNCVSKLSTLSANHPKSANNSKHHYSSSMLNVNNQSRRILGYRRSVDAMRLSHSGKENRNYRMSVQKMKETSEYQYIMEIGEGTFGKVWKVRHKQSGNIYALKAMLKTKILAKKSVDSVMNQRTILARLKNSKFIVNAIQAFQDQQYLYLLMQYMPKGDLRFVIYSKSKVFMQQEAKFLICCLICAVRFIHKHQVIHRDIKPENLVVDNKGYLRLTDMGINVMVVELQLTWLLNHSKLVYNLIQAIIMQLELLHLNCLMEEPYASKIREQIYQQMQQRKKLKFEQGITLEAKLFCQNLLHIQVSKRLGFKNGISDLQNHPWFSDVNWVQFRKKRYKSPFDLKHSDRQMIQYQKLLQSVSQEESKLRLKLKHEFQFLFKGYNYNF